jgi:VIT1/CCC1 family predicted Fe2+/Mn2+ transporter
MYGSYLKDVILGGQDGLVNVLGIVLAIATATRNSLVVIIAGLAATFAESISMGAVAYTSSKAARDFYQSELEIEKQEIRKLPDIEKQEIRDIYKKKGFHGKILETIVEKITSNKKIWLETMMREELGISLMGFEHPVKNGVIVLTASFIGSIIPLTPFFLLSVPTAILVSLILSLAALFTLGSVKAKLTVGSWLRSGLEVAIIGILAALSGYLVGSFLGTLM